MSVKAVALVLFQVSGKGEMACDLAETSVDPRITFLVFITDVIRKHKNTAVVV